MGVRMINEPTKWHPAFSLPDDELEKVVCWQPPTGLDQCGIWFVFARHIHGLGWMRREDSIVLDYVTWWMHIPPVPDQPA